MNKAKAQMVGAMASAVLALALLVTAVMPGLALAYTTYPLQPEDAEVADALGYLDGIQAADGSIGCYADSAWAVMAIAVAGDDPHDWNGGDASIVDYLKDNAALMSGEWNLGTAYARSVLAIVAACEDPSAFGVGDPTYAPDGDYLSKMKELHNGIQFEDGFGTTDTLNEDFWGLMALIAAGEPQDSPMVTSTVAFILDNQGEDGGWSWATFENPWYWESDVDDTAAAIMALVAAGIDPAADSIVWGLEYLEYEQMPSGGFASWGVENAGSTTWAIGAIVAAGQDPTSAEWTTGGNPVDFLLTLQEEEGPFVYADPLPEGYLPMREKMTSDAIVALLGKPYPVKVRQVYSFEDPWRGTMLTINPECKTFRFTAPDGYDSGTVQADRMRVRHGRITIWHNDADLRFASRANINRDFCFGLLLDKATWTRHLIYDPRGVE